MSAETLPLKEAKKAAMVPFAVFFIAVLASYTLLKSEMMDRPPLQYLDTSQRPASPMEGKQAPGFALKDLNGATVDLDDHIGKILFINFWATWCTPCVIEMPGMEAFYRKFKSKNLVMLAVSIDKKKERIREFVEGKDFTFELFIDPHTTVARQFGVTSIPATFVVNPEGEIVSQAMGSREWMDPAIIDYFEKLFARKGAGEKGAS